MFFCESGGQLKMTMIISVRHFFRLNCKTCYCNFYSAKPFRHNFLTTQCSKYVLLTNSNLLPCKVQPTPLSSITLPVAKLKCTKRHQSGKNLSFKETFAAYNFDQRSSFLSKNSNYNLWTTV